MRCMAFNHTGSPIRTSPDHFLFADPRSFSQLTTSFFAFGSLGIPRSLFFSFSYFVNHMRLLQSHIFSFCLFWNCSPLRNSKKLEFLFRLNLFLLLTSLSLSILSMIFIRFVSERECKGTAYFWKSKLFRKIFHFFSTIPGKNHPKRQFPISKHSEWSLRWHHSRRHWGARRL